MLRHKEGRFITMTSYGNPLDGGISWQLRQDDFLVPVVCGEVQWEGGL